jgi:NADPH:quinone reductase-like Zn-dependent oxidoreductase
VKAIVYRAYGSPADVLALEDIEVPEVGEDGVLVRVVAAALNPLDWRLMMGRPAILRAMTGLRRPKDGVPGIDLAGVVEAVGKGVTELAPGDEVFGHKAGACAEYLRCKESQLAPKPAGLTFEQAAAIPVAGLTALQALRDKGRLRSGQRVLINGASGGVGTFAVQIARALGAAVTGVCSTGNVDLVRSLGADGVIDYTREDITRGERRYDLILDNVANLSSSACRRVLAPEGMVLRIGAPHRMTTWSLFALLLGPALQSSLGKQKFAPFLSKESRADLLVLKELVEAGKVRPVLDRTYPLSQTADALAYLEAGHARGKVVITI